jgi:hypothetical protein
MMGNNIEQSCLAILELSDDARSRAQSIVETWIAFRLERERAVDRDDERPARPARRSEPRG